MNIWFFRILAHIISQSDINQDTVTQLNSLNALTKLSIVNDNSGVSIDLSSLVAEDYLHIKRASVLKLINLKLT